MSESTGDKGGLIASPVVAVVFLTILGATLRFYHLNSGLWYDEIKTVLDSVRLPLLQIITHFPGNNDHLLFSVLAHLSTTIFGEHSWSIRLPAVIFGIASIPMLYLVGITVTSRLEALLATSILTVSYHHVWFSQNARGYTALLFWVLLATFLLLQWLLHNKKAPLVGYAVVAALGSYTHLTMVFVVVAHALSCAYILFVQRNSGDEHQDWRHPVASFVMGGILTVFLYAPVLADMQSFFVHTPAPANVATPTWALWSTISGLQLGFGTVWAVAIGGIIAGIGVLDYFKQRPAIVYLFVLPAPVTLALAVAMGRPIFPRFAFFLIGFGLLVSVRGATTIGNWIAARTKHSSSLRRLGSGMAVALTISAVGLSMRSLPYGYRYPKQDYHHAIDFVEENKETADLVATLGKTASIPIHDYFGKPWLRIDTSDQLHEARIQGRKVWLIHTMAAYTKKRMPALWSSIQRNCRQLESFDGTVANGTIYVHQCPPENAATE